MPLGSFEITALSDGTVDLPVDKLLTNTTAAKVQAALMRAYLKVPVETSVNGYLVNTGSKLVLIDAGAAGLFGPTLGKLLAHLRASGYTPEQVDEIYLTHMHADTWAASPRPTARPYSPTPRCAPMPRNRASGSTRPHSTRRPRR